MPMPETETEVGVGKVWVSKLLFAFAFIGRGIGRAGCRVSRKAGCAVVGIVAVAAQTFV